MADWMQGWGAVVSIPLSLLAVIFTGWLLRHEIGVRRQERAEREMAQARLVQVQMFWVFEDSPQGRARVGGFKVINRSSQAIYSVHRILASTEPYDPTRDKALLSEKMPGDSEIKIWFDRPVSEGGAGASTGPIRRVTLLFEDIEGLRWSRRDGTSPERLSTLGEDFANRTTRQLLVEFLWTSRIIGSVWNLKDRARWKVRGAVLRLLHERSPERPYAGR